MSKQYKYTALLTIAGSDSCGGAGIQADLKTFSALGCYGTSAITAITVQNTLGVSGIHSIPAEIVKGQIKVVMDDIKPMAIKIGMVHSAELAVAIAAVLKEYPQIPVIFDPVMVSTSGHRLIEKDTIAALQKELFPKAKLITPNLSEAEILAAMKINNVADMKEAARRMITAGCNAVLVKGGHLQGPDLFDVYLDKNGFEKTFRSTAISTKNTHGTGCTLSSAIAAFVGLNNDIYVAIEKAKAYVHEAIVAGQDVKTGEGHGPLNHLFDPQKLFKHEME
ncbi:bifunctional hydroxymethylpyrimidine kinase/phosphomethylpyrimidine kinase [Mucilaginibacter dorajii]|uniref:hydroxymethylpyrimidine kinase n=1 Tax=Mucilaginibacter dorajii TaxID=692994 RepID=A0ABP7QER8_9SPHI|nr:bifunctional hydroxymethylpyrimidine kinase/phosphomethylpyrimidine kinase [Mucilaginibacter dorajii]MCS3733142.1 hydroxymethylpyrimidine/phosphomethylpyrimidine kinase [Mucilaginibacter dorajii]